MPAGKKVSADTDKANDEWPEQADWVEDASATALVERLTRQHFGELRPIFGVAV